MCPVRNVTYVSGRSQRVWSDFSQTIEDPKGHAVVPFFVSFRPSKARKYTVPSLLTRASDTTLRLLAWNSWRIHSGTNPNQN